ncbi:hypothetical protein Tdes44962_MAKER06691 [Teratosphaeria destructans]|uniref:Uncharacterized protein n=1 Tax=Teratosphaeria destructans TaxID=418781 RepID=A0A9W7W7D0_9PEZI|nr:hypothetical protein Tdes44962_MAKER06691 [Teratosphaeria destructans]
MDVASKKQHGRCTCRGAERERTTSSVLSVAKAENWMSSRADQALVSGGAFDLPEDEDPHVDMLGHDRALSSQAAGVMRGAVDGG